MKQFVTYCLIMLFIGCYLNAATPEQVKAIYDKAPTDNNALNYVRALHNAKRYDEAVTFGTVVCQSMDNSALRYITYMCYKKTSDKEALKTFAKQMFDTYNDHLSLGNYVSAWCATTDNVDEVLTWATAQYAERPSVDLANGIGNCYKKLGQPDQMLDFGHAACVQFQTSHTWAWHLANLMRFDKDRQEKAADLYVLCAKAGKSYSASALDTGISIYLKLKKTDVVIQTLSDVADKLPNPVMKALASNASVFNEEAFLTVLPKYNFTANGALPATKAFNHYPWTTGTIEEGLTFCTKVLLATPVSTESAEFVNAVRDKKLALQ